MLKEFRAFLVKENVLALAIAVVIGTALTKLVAAAVADLIMPIVGAVIPGGDWRGATFSVGRVNFLVGDFLSAVLDFLIIGFVAWRLSKAFMKPADEKPGSPTKECRYCIQSIDARAVRCPHCTSELGAA
ncbi:MAG: large conductance mechanosensitive channel protein MscL [Gemmatimonadaceae bacterium]